MDRHRGQEAGRERR